MKQVSKKDKTTNTFKFIVNNFVKVELKRFFSII